MPSNEVCVTVNECMLFSHSICTHNPDVPFIGKSNKMEYTSSSSEKKKLERHVRMCFRNETIYQFNSNLSGVCVFV